MKEIREKLEKLLNEEIKKRGIRLPILGNELDLEAHIWVRYGKIRIYVNVLDGKNRGLGYYDLITGEAKATYGTARSKETLMRVVALVRELGIDTTLVQAFEDEKKEKERKEAELMEKVEALKKFSLPILVGVLGDEGAQKMVEFFVRQGKLNEQEYTEALKVAETMTEEERKRAWEILKEVKK